jgi:hypothetical protein
MMKTKLKLECSYMHLPGKLWIVVMVCVCSPLKVSEAVADTGFEVSGFVENATYVRKGRGVSKVRNTAQIEIEKDFGGGDKVSNISFHGTFRGTYDAVYDLNDSEFGDHAGGPITLEQTGAPANALGPGSPVIPPAQVPFGSGLSLPGGDFDSTANPNNGLQVLGSELHETDGGVALGVPVRPCDEDSRGCIDDYMDKDKDELRFPEFNSRLDFIREAYFDATLPFKNGDGLNFKFGRQQVVWGRTDLFRVLDVINPVDFSRNNIYDELEDIRIPMGIATAEYRAGQTKVFDDFNVQLLWKWEPFRPNDLGQGGQSNVILDAGSFFRGMNNCWENGCTVANFAAGGVATDFGPHQIGIRKANLHDSWTDERDIGIKVEGVFKDVGFSLNALRYRSQFPTLRGGIPADNGFTPAVEATPFPYLIAFDIDFPMVNLVGGSLDFYVDPIKSVFRVEAAYTSGEEFANTLQPRLFSDSDVFRWVIGWDRNTFVPFLNRRRAFLTSVQVFGQHLLDHELENGPLGKVGMPDWEDSYIMTALLKGWWLNDRLSPQILFAHDFKANANVMAPSIDWLISDKWRMTFGANFKWGDGARKFSDCRSCNPWPPFTATPAHGDPTQPGDVGLGGFEPLGRFRAGPIGMAREENELQLTLRYRF